MGCEFSDECLFLEEFMRDTPTVVALLRERYCAGEESACARHAVLSHVGADGVPPDLFPHEGDRARSIIRTKSRPSQ